MKKQEDQEKQVEELQKQVEEWKGKYLRALADYQNLERWANQNRKEMKERLIEEIMHSVLLFRDEILRANNFLKNTGLKHAIEAFDATLKYYNIREIEALGKEYNPHEMECIEMVAGEDDRTIAIEVTRPGFFIGNKVLRVAQVKVSRGKNRVTNIPSGAGEN